MGRRSDSFVSEECTKSEMTGDVRRACELRAAVANQAGRMFRQIAGTDLSLARTYIVESCKSACMGLHLSAMHPSCRVVLFPGGSRHWVLGYIEELSAMLSDYGLIPLPLLYSGAQTLIRLGDYATARTLITEHLSSLLEELPCSSSDSLRNIILFGGLKKSTAGWLVENLQLINNKMDEISQAPGQEPYGPNAAPGQASIHPGGIATSANSRELIQPSKVADRTERGEKSQRAVTWAASVRRHAWWVLVVAAVIGGLVVSKLLKKLQSSARRTIPTI